MRRFFLIFYGALVCAFCQQLDTLIDLREHPENVPKKLTLKAPVGMKVVSGTKEIGSLTLPSGAEVDLLAINESSLLVGVSGARGTVSPGQTDLWERVEGNKLASPLPAATPPPATGPAKPAVKPTPSSLVAGLEKPDPDARVQPGAEIKVPFESLGPDWNNESAAMTIRIPENYSPDKPVPLMVWLSGGMGSNHYGGGAELVDKKDFLLVGLPYPHSVDRPRDASNKGEIEKVWAYERPMMKKLEEMVPNIDSRVRIVAGFSNGAHVIGGCLGQSVRDFAKAFNVFILVEGGNSRGYNYPNSRGSHFYYAWGDTATTPDFAAMIESTAKKSHMEVETHRMEGVGHAFPESEKQAIKRWLQEKVFPKLLSGREK